jgi:hypothetical protein
MNTVGEMNDIEKIGILLEFIDRLNDTSIEIIISSISIKHI